MKLLVTGANGFVGSALCRTHHRETTEILAVVRSQGQTQYLPATVKPILSDLTTLTTREDVLARVDCIVHMAARVHVMHDSVRDPLSAFRAVNTAATRELAIAAAKSGVRRFVYLSSIKVNGDGSSGAYTELSKPNPQDPYGISKWEAECALQEVAAETGLEVVILRPPLIYGPQVKANFLQLMRLVKRGVPLPLGSVKNARSLLYVGNLVDAIFACATHANAAGQTFLVSDGEDVSTPELVEQLAIALACDPHLLPIHPDILKFFGKITRKSAAIHRLLGSLTIDSSKLRQTLNWQPPYSLQAGLKATADWYCN